MHILAERAQKQGCPLIDGNLATFVWLGNTAPSLAGDFTDWERGKPVEMTRAARGVWTYPIELPLDAYIEYAYFDENLERIPDPLNSRITPNGVGNINHYFYMPQGGPTALSSHQANTPRGKISAYQLDAPSVIAYGRRKIRLYQPPTTQAVPLVVVWDGEDYFKRGCLTTIVDNLILQERIQPLALAMIKNAGSERSIEYNCNESIPVFLKNYLLPLAQQNLNLLDPREYPGAYGVLGASMGGLMALYTALRLPHIFGRALCQSGAYTYLDHDTITYDLVRSGDPQAVKVWMDAGLYDFKTLLIANRRMSSLLSEYGYKIEYREYAAGHNYPAWRDEVWRGLEYLFPKP